MNSAKETATQALAEKFRSGAVALRDEFLKRPYLEPEIRHLEAMLLRELTQGQFVSAWSALARRWGYTDSGLQDLGNKIIRQSPARFSSLLVAVDPMFALAAVPPPIEVADYELLASAWASVPCKWVAGLLIHRFMDSLRASRRPPIEISVESRAIDLERTARAFEEGICKLPWKTAADVAADLIERASSNFIETFGKHGIRIFKGCSGIIGRDADTVEAHREALQRTLPRELWPSLVFVRRIDGDYADLADALLAQWRSVLRSDEYVGPTGSVLGPPVQLCFESLMVAVADDIRKGGQWWQEEWHEHSSAFGPWTKTPRYGTERRLLLLASVFSAASYQLSASGEKDAAANAATLWLDTVADLLPDVLLFSLPPVRHDDLRKSAESRLCVRHLMAGPVLLEGASLDRFIGRFVPYLRSAGDIDDARTVALHLKCDKLVRALDVARPSVEKFQSSVLALYADEGRARRR